MEYIKFTLSGDLAFFKDPYKNDVECSYPHIHRPVLLGICGAILGLRGRESDMEYYHKLGTMGVSIVPSKIKFDTFRDAITNTTCFGNGDGYTQIINKVLLVDPRWDIYLKQNDVEDCLWEDLKRRLLTGEHEYTVGLGERKLFADIDNVEIGEMKLANIDDIDKISSIIYRSDIKDELKSNRITFTVPVKLHEILGKWEYVNERLFFTNQFVYEVCEDIEIYDTGEDFIRFIE